MSSLPKTQGVNAPNPEVPVDKIYGWEWPVIEGYKIQFKDGSVAHYPSWHETPNRILCLQTIGYYEGVEVTAITWDQVQD